MYSEEHKCILGFCFLGICFLWIELHPFGMSLKVFPWESLVENRNVIPTVPAVSPGLSDVYLNLSNTHSVQSLMYLQFCTAAADT